MPGTSRLPESGGATLLFAVATLVVKELMSNPAAERQRVRALIERSGVAMLMNVDDRDTHVGRPMLPLFIQDDPHIYFLTHQSSRKVMQLSARPQVGLTMVSANCYLVITGSAHISRDRELIRRLWSPTYRAWFPDGQTDRQATVIRVAVERIDYWEPPTSQIVRLMQLIKAVATGQAVDTPRKTLDGFVID